MGTRSITHIKSEGLDSNTLVTVYRQYDGYPTGMGADILKALGSRNLCNGYSDPDLDCNGMGSAAAMLISTIADPNKTGNVYIHKTDSGGGVDYTYTLYDGGGHIAIEVVGYDQSTLYRGKLDDFDPEKVEADEFE